MTGFEFATATEIVFGRGRVKELGRRTATFGERVLLVTGKTPERVQPILERAGFTGEPAARVAIGGEPTTADVERGVLLAREAKADWVLAIGGGSALDAAKAIAILARNPGEPLDYLEVVGRGRALTQASLPAVLVPTTAGTGAEVTKNAVLAVESARVKVSLRSLYMLPRLALVDSELTHGVPPEVTAATGLDALTPAAMPIRVIAVEPPVSVVVDAVAARPSPRSAASSG